MSCRLVCEIGSNHDASFERAMALVEAAARAGFNDVKSQAWTVEGLFAPEALMARPDLLERKCLEMPWGWHKPLANRCKELGMGYGVSVFQADDVRRAAVEADWLKVSSYSLLDEKLLDAVNAQPKDVVVSTGMATEAEVEAAMAWFGGRAGVTLLHCVSAYPAPAYEANLRSIPYMRERFGVPIGWSDHTRNPWVVARAKHVYRADMLELHWDLDDCKGPEWLHSWKPKSIGYIDEVAAEASDGGFYAWDGKSGRKAPTLSEESERAWRADPSDGLRPLLATRATLAASQLEKTT